MAEGGPALMDVLGKSGSPVDAWTRVALSWRKSSAPNQCVMHGPGAEVRSLNDYVVIEARTTYQLIAHGGPAQGGLPGLPAHGGLPESPFPACGGGPGVPAHGGLPGPSGSAGSVGSAGSAGSVGSSGSAGSVGSA